MQHDARILGNADFAQTLLQEAEENVARQIRGQGKNDSAAVIKKICKAEGVKEEEPRHGGRRRKVSQARAEIAHHLAREMGFPLAEIARELGVGTSAIAMAIRKEEGRGEN